MKPLMTLALVAIATPAGIWMSRYEDGQRSERKDIVRLLFYWLLTIVVTFELAAGVVWDRVDENRIAALERKVGQQVVEIDFLRGCLQHVEEQRRLQALTTRNSSTRTSKGK